MIEFIGQPFEPVRLGDYLKDHLSDTQWSAFRAAVAFVKRSGVQHIRQGLEDFSRHGTVKIAAGINHRGTSREGLESLLESLGDRGEIWVFHNGEDHTFHPKLYLFKSDSRADVVVGSGNLTEGGLFTNYEADLAVSLDLTIQEHRDVLRAIEETLDAWSDEAPGTAKRLTSNLLKRLVSEGKVLTESQLRESKENASAGRPAASEPLFARAAVRAAPPPPVDAQSPKLRERESKYLAGSHSGVDAEPREDEDGESEEEDYVAPSPPAQVAAQADNHRGFLMTLQNTDVGVGQTTKGTSRRSPEIFIPVKAMRLDPDFWGYPYSFGEDPNKPGKWDRPGVKMRLGGHVVDVNMMTWPDKTDFRLRSEALRSAGNIGDILRIERADGSAGFAYYVEIIPPGTADFDRYLGQCNDRPHSSNSLKQFGYY